MSVIPKEQSGAFQRWEINSFDRPPPAEVVKAPITAMEAPISAESSGEPVSDFKLPTAEDIERIHNEAQQAGHQAGYETGHAEGYAAGQAAGRAEAERIAGLCDNLQTAVNGLEQQVADQILELALEVARQVVRSTLSSEPERILPIIREAIAALPLHHGNVTLHLNPGDAQLLHTLLGNQLGQSGWHLLEDATITAGGCLLRAGTSEIDATLETRWRRVLEAIGQPPPPPTE